MKLTRYIAVTLTAAVLGAVPAVAAANGKGNAPGQKTKSTQSTSTPTTTPAPKGKAYGKDCRGQSKQHVAGVPGTLFSACVRGAAQAAKTPKSTPTQDCKGLSTKHVKGSPGTPFSACVSGAAKQRGHH